MVLRQARLPRAQARAVTPATLALATFVALAPSLLGGSRARAGANDIALMNLCDTSSGSCPWVVQDASGTRVDLSRDPNATSNFRSLMSELGVVVAPRLQTPADTLGFAGFQFAVELGTTQISRDQRFWNGVEGVEPGNPLARRPDRWLTTVGAFARKGMWFPIPGLEWGVGAVKLLDSGLWAAQGYVKLALLEGFHRWPIPSAAVRGSVSHLLGSDQVVMTIGSLDAVLSKAMSIGGTARFEPFAGWNIMFIDARSRRIDATPSCDAHRLQQATMAVPGCPPSQVGTSFDFDATFTFPDQDVIRRHRFYGGAKLKLSVLFATLQYAYAPEGRTRDERGGGLAARDESRPQHALSLSAGFDF